MTTKNGWNRWLVAAALLTLISPQARAQTEMPQTLDQEYARLAEEVPGFGGLYLDEDGVTHVYLTDLSREKEAQDLGDRVEVHQGDYDFRDLFAWKDEVRPFLAERGAIYLDIDESRNRLVFGVERDALDEFNADLKKLLEDTHVPPEAVLVEADEPIEPAESLLDKIRPVPGGVQIQTLGGSSCTLGVNATRLGVRGFITASHCTATRGVVDSTPFFQSAFGALVGIETVDPPLFTGGSCPSGHQCRLSDAAFVAYTPASLSAGGKIANLLCAPFPSTLTIDPQLPRLSVTGALLFSPASGSVVAKTGRTTGCTLGTIKNTCLDTNVMLSTVTMLCQNRVTAASQKGDSGSPVFIHGGDKATLSGIYWGVSPTTYTYSPWLFVFTELGGGVMPDAP